MGLGTPKHFAIHKRHRLEIRGRVIPADLKELRRQDRQTCNDMEPHPQILNYSAPVSVGGQKSRGAKGKAAAKEELPTERKCGEHSSYELDSL